MTMAEGQWDAMLAAGYQAGVVLLELDDNERPVRASRNAAFARKAARWRTLVVRGACRLYRTCC